MHRAAAISGSMVRGPNQLSPAGHGKGCHSSVMEPTHQMPVAAGTVCLRPSGSRQCVSSSRRPGVNACYVKKPKDRSSSHMQPGPGLQDAPQGVDQQQDMQRQLEQTLSAPEQAPSPRPNACDWDLDQQPRLDRGPAQRQAAHKQVPSPRLSGMQGFTIRRRAHAGHALQSKDTMSDKSSAVPDLDPLPAAMSSTIAADVGPACLAPENSTSAATPDACPLHEAPLSAAAAATASPPQTLPSSAINQPASPPLQASSSSALPHPKPSLATCLSAAAGLAPLHPSDASRIVEVAPSTSAAIQTMSPPPQGLLSTASPVQCPPQRALSSAGAAGTTHLPAALSSSASATASTLYPPKQASTWRMLSIQGSPGEHHSVPSSAARKPLEDVCQRSSDQAASQVHLPSPAIPRSDMLAAVQVRPLVQQSSGMDTTWQGSVHPNGSPKTLALQGSPGMSLDAELPRGKLREHAHRLQPAPMRCPDLPTAHRAAAAGPAACQKRLTSRSGDQTECRPAQAAMNVAGEQCEQPTGANEHPPGLTMTPVVQQQAASGPHVADVSHADDKGNHPQTRSKPQQKLNSDSAASGVFASTSKGACAQQAADEQDELAGLGGVLQQWVNPAIPPPSAQPILDLRALGLTMPAAPVAREDLHQVDA